MGEKEYLQCLQNCQKEGLFSQLAVESYVYFVGKVFSKLDNLNKYLDLHKVGDNCQPLHNNQ